MDAVPFEEDRYSYIYLQWLFPVVYSLLFILSFMSWFGFCTTTANNSSSSTAPLPNQLQGSSPTPVECAKDYYTCDSSGGVCQCDERLCTRYRDCCAESRYTHNTFGPEFTCVSTSFRRTTTSMTDNTAYWMIASCPKSESASIYSYYNLKSFLASYARFCVAIYKHLHAKTQFCGCRKLLLSGSIKKYI